MVFQTIRLQQRLILVIDEDLSSYKGMLRICQDKKIDVLYFDRHQAVIDWFLNNGQLLNSNRTACCIVIEPTFIDVFENQHLAECLMICPKICISRASSAETLLETSKYGLFEFIAKPFGLEQMQATLDRAFAFFEQGTHVQTRFSNLTKRELQTCELLAEGCPNKDIAEKLGISIKTVKVHRANLMRKIEVKSIADLLRSYSAFQSLSNSASRSMINSYHDSL